MFYPTELCHRSCRQPKLYTKPDSRTCTTVLCTLSEQERLAVFLVGRKKWRLFLQPTRRTANLSCSDKVHKTVVQVLLSGLVYSLGCLQLL